MNTLTWRAATIAVLALCMTAAYAQAAVALTGQVGSAEWLASINL
mgnify:CR=1 FL=1